MQLDDLRKEKSTLEDNISELIQTFIYETNTIPKNFDISVPTVKSFTGAVVLASAITVNFNLEV